MRKIEEKYWKDNNMSSFPKCIVCGNELSSKQFLTYKLGYLDTCCVNCTRKLDRVKEKRKQTNLERYGVENPFQSKIKKDKIKQTNLERYGTNNPAQSKIIKDKIKQTNLERYSVSFVGQINLSKLKTNINRNNTFIKKKLPIRFQKIYEQEKVTPLFSINDYSNVKEKYKWKCEICSYEFESDLNNGKVVKCPLCKPKSQPQFEVYEFITQELKIENVIYDDRIQIKPYEIDIYLPDYKFGIEMNGVYWHQGRDKYHNMKTKLCENVGVFLFHITDVEWKEKNTEIKEKILNILNILNFKKSI